MLDSPLNDPSEPCQQAHCHHGEHRIRRHRAGRTFAAGGSGVPVGAAGAAEQAPRRHRASAPRDLQERRIRSPPSRAQGSRAQSEWRDVRGHDRPARAGGRRRCQHRWSRAQRGGPRHRHELRHRHPLRCRGGVRLPARQRGGDQPAGPDPHRRHVERRWRHTSPRLGQHLLRRRQPARQRAGGTGQRWPVGPRAQLAQRGRCGSAVAQRHRSDQPAAREAHPLPQRSAQGARGRGSTCAGGEDREHSRRLGEGSVGRGRPRPRRQRRLARRVRLHQGARRAGADRGQGQRAGLDRSTVDHRVGARRTVPRLDPRLPHGRAGHPQLCPRPAEGVPRRTRGHRRRDPRRHRRRGHHRRRRARTRPKRRASPRSPAAGSIR